MDSRTCPHCNYTYSLVEYLRKPFFLGVLNTWSCCNCGRRLTLSTNRRIILSCVGLFPTAFAGKLANDLGSLVRPVGLAWCCIILVLICWVVMIFGFEKFQAVKEEPVDKAG